MAAECARICCWWSETLAGLFTCMLQWGEVRAAAYRQLSAISRRGSQAHLWGGQGNGAGLRQGVGVGGRGRRGNMHSSMRTPAVVLLVVMAVVVGGVRAVVAVVSAMAVLSEVKQVSGVGMGVGMVKLGVVELVARACTLLGQVMFTRALPDEGLCL
eukprot:scaffold9914_cov17-Tisochrysis_lutea.AAC.1